MLTGEEYKQSFMGDELNEMEKKMATIVVENGIFESEED